MPRRTPRPRTSRPVASPLARAPSLAHLVDLEGLSPALVRRLERGHKLAARLARRPMREAVAAVMERLQLDGETALALVALPRLRAAVAGITRGALERAAAAARTLEPRRLPARAKRPRCGATCRHGGACQAPALWLDGEAAPRTRCKLHGGASTGPTTADGRARVAASLRARWEAWRAGDGPRPGARPSPPEASPPPSSPAGVVLAWPSTSPPLGLAAE